MASATASRAALSDDDLKELVELIKEVDSVELKLTIPEQAHFTTVRALGLDPLQAQIRQVTGREVTSLELRLHSLPEPPEPARGAEETR